MNPQWKGPAIDLGTMAAPGAMINAKKTAGLGCRGRKIMA
jgi:hypothetical protein